MDSIEQAAIYMNNGEVDEAQKLLEKLIPQASDEEKFSISELYYDWGFFNEAITLLEELLVTYPKEGELITKLAEMYIELEKDETATELLNQIENEDEFYVSSLLQLADLYQAQGLFEVSEQKLLEAKKIAPEEPVIDFALGELLFSVGQYNRAIPFYEKTVSKFNELNHISIRERLAECHAFLGHYDKALHLYEKIDTNDVDTLFKYGFTAFKQDRHDVAIQVWKEVIEIDPHYYAVYEKLATVLKEEGLVEEAYTITKQGLTYDEFNKELFLLAGQLAITLNEREEAVYNLEEAIRLDTDYQEAILLIVQLYKEEQRFEDIIRILTDVKDKGESDPIYDWELAKAYTEEEQYDKALVAYKEASNHLTYEKNFLKEYGYFLVEEGLQREAIDVLEQYIILEPLDEETNSFLERLKFSNNE